MPIDNTIYETLDDWWDPTGSVAGIHAMNPPRAAYFRDVIAARLAPQLRRLPILDLGCGGGLLTEELLKAGLAVTGLDAAHGALRVASEHARIGGLEARYAQALAERLPVADGTCAAVVSSDFIEHVADLAVVLGEVARVLAPGGLFLYDTINRTWLTRLFHIGVLQEWRKLVPPDTHAWRSFIRPEELARALRAASLSPVEVRGLRPVRPLRFALRLLVHRRGQDRMPAFQVGGFTAASYVGYAIRDGGWRG
jgi:2-polyprenyl-6-hydroxyphenyl methylase/3-demethylubiquinone-9 3-methyltransferase